MSQELTPKGKVSIATIEPGSAIDQELGRELLKLYGKGYRNIKLHKDGRVSCCKFDCPDVTIQLGRAGDHIFNTDKELTKLEKKG